MLSISPSSIHKRRVFTRVIPLFLFVALSVILFVPQQVLAKEYKNSDGDKGQYDLIVKLSGDSSKVDRVTAERVVPNYSGKKYVNKYNLAKKDATTYRQDHFQFITDNMSCRQIPSLIAQNPGGTGLGQSSGFYDFKVAAYDKAGKKLSPTTEVTFDYGDDCGKDKTVKLTVSSTQANPNSLGTLNGTIEAYEFGKKIPLKTVDLRLTGPANKKVDYIAGSGALKAIEIPPGTYTLSGPVRCGTNVTGNTCTTNDDFTTTGPIKAGNNKIDIIYIDGEVNICGDGCNKATFLAGKLNGTAATAPVNQNSEDLTCESGDNPLNWILCPVFNMVAGFADFLFNTLINPFLITTPIDTSGSSAIYKIWSTFRIYGNIFLIIALLIIVFGQSIGGGILDAYTAKKVLPRLLAAAILINISIYVVAFMVDITNIIGGGIGALITAPIGDAGVFKISPSGVEAGIIMGASAIGLVAGSAALMAALTTTAGASFIAIAVLLPAALGLLAAVVTLVLRQGIIIALVIVSPVAFALYCLPNTEKYFKQWWSTLTKALVVYPIIIMIFAVADVLAFTSVAANGGPISGAFSQVMAFLLQFIPLLMIPFAFRLAGGAIGKIGDIAAGASAKANNMAKNRREEAGFRFKTAKATKASQINTGLNGTALGRRISQSPRLSRLQSRRTQRLDQLNRNLSADVGKTAGAQAIQHDDDAIRAATYSSYSDAVAGLTARNEASYGPNITDTQREQARMDSVRAASAVSASTGFGRAQAIWATEAMGKTGTSFDNVKDMAQTIARASGGDTSTTASLAGNLNSVNKQVGRHDLAPGFGTLNKLALGESGRAGFSNTDLAYEEAAVNAWNSGSLYQHANDKPQNIKAAIQHHESMLQRSTKAQGDAILARSVATSPADIAKADADLAKANQEIEQAAVFFNELKVMAPNASGAVKLEIDAASDRNQGLLSTAVRSLDATPSDRTTDKPEVQESRVLQPNGDYVVSRSLTGSRQESAQERIDRHTRTFERVDPNRL